MPSHLKKEDGEGQRNTLGEPPNLDNFLIRLNVNKKKIRKQSEAIAKTILNSCWTTVTSVHYSVPDIS